MHYPESPKEIVSEKTGEREKGRIKVNIVYEKDFPPELNGTSVHCYKFWIINSKSVAFRPIKLYSHSYFSGSSAWANNI